MITPKRINELIEATPVELEDGTPVQEVEVWNGVKWLNKKTPRKNTILDGMFGLIQSVTDTTYTLMLRAAYVGAITAVGTRMGVGTCTVQIQIGGTPLGGSSNSATTTYSEQAHATDNVFVVNDIITMVITASAASPADLDFVLKMVRIL